MSEIQNSTQFKVALCGRPNVGKSSLFNRLVGRKKALVHDLPGVTRDLRREQAPWDQSLEIVDLAGLELLGTNDSLQKLSVEAALEFLKKEAELILFTIDARTELTPLDFEIARLLQKLKKEVIFVATKVDTESVTTMASRVYELGLDAPLVFTSAEHDRGIGELKETLSKWSSSLHPKQSSSDTSLTTISESETSFEKTSDSALGRPLRLGVFGRPNVGKSTLVNTLLGFERMIVSDIAGTTVDSIDSEIFVDDKKYILVDTAGIRRKSKTQQGVEVLSVVQTLASLKRIDIALLVLDGFEGLTDQDEKIAQMIVEEGRACILLVNKWDLCRISKDKYAEKLRESLKFLDFAPVIFTSGLKGDGLKPLFDLAQDIAASRMKTASTGELNRIIQKCERQQNPRGAKMYYSVQTSKNPPTVTIQVQSKKKVHYSLERYIYNELRRHYDWMGSPIRLVFKEKNRS